MSKPLLKYCGNKSREDFETTVQSNADYLGFVFAESKRRVLAEDVALWVKGVKLGKKKLVGIFVNQPLEEIVEITEKIPLSIIQCHGDESPEFIKSLIERTNVEIWKAIHHEDTPNLGRMRDFLGLVGGFVIDKKVGNVYGGTGSSFDWSFIPAYVEEAKKAGAICFIAGGINEQTIEQLLPYQPEGIDISSGIEDNFKKSCNRISLIERKVIHDGTYSTYTR